MRKARLIDLLIDVDRERMALAAENWKLKDDAARLRDELFALRVRHEEDSATCNERTRLLNEYARAFSEIEDLVKKHGGKIAILHKQYP